MTRARRELISLTDTPYYHCIARCVRRAFLCGADRHSGDDFSHRRAWVVDRMQTLSSMFAIDICSYAIMSNHYHLVLKADAKRARSWSMDEVIDRWNILFIGPDLVKRYQSGTLLDQAELNKVTEIVNEWRKRLVDVSWYMRALNEHIARLANAEDNCTGRFWEGRFKSQALLDEQALLTCMAYVDLNPIRAQMAGTPESSDFTSVQQRIMQVKDDFKPKPSTQKIPLPRYPLTNPAELANTSRAAPTSPLLDFIGWVDSSAGIPFRLDDYLELVDWSGRIIRADKSGAIPTGTPSILSRLGVDDGEFLKHVSPKTTRQTDSRNATGFYTAIGTPARLKKTAAQWARKFFKGFNKAQRLFPAKPAT